MDNSFETHATPSLQKQLVTMLPQSEGRSVFRCLQNGLALLEERLADFTDGRVVLTDGQRRLLGEIRQRNGWVAQQKH